MDFPIFFENSQVPALLSKVSPVEINAITLGPLVFSRGEISPRVRNHEAIHWEQYKETLILGFLFLYAVYWVIGLLKYRSGSIAYFSIPFEKEAYSNDENQLYLICRKRYAWREYLE